jgi:hypothetical protein
MMLKPGEVYFSQKELAFSSLAIGVTDNVSFLVGSVLPLSFVEGGKGLNVLVGLKLGVPVTSQFHLAAGVETLVLPVLGGMGGIGFASATWGDADAHLTLSAGHPFVTDFNDSRGGIGFPQGVYLFTLSANLRVSDRVALMSENWVLSDFSGTNATLHALGFRLINRSVAVELGFIDGLSIRRQEVVVPYGSVSGTSTEAEILSPIPIPWVDFTWNFG